MKPDDKTSARISFLVTSLSYGGAETSLVRLATNLRTRGWRVKLISMLPPETWVDQLVSGGIEVATLNMRRGVPDPRAIYRLRSLIREWRPLILHTHMVHANLLGRITRLFTFVPVIISTAHNINEGARWREIAYRMTDFLADITTNVSEAAVARYIQVGAVPSSRIRFVPNGLNTDVFRPNAEARLTLRRNLEIEDRFVWLAVGRLTEAKDYPNMIRAFAQLDTDRSMVLLIVGQGELTDDLMIKADESGIGDRIRFLGVRQDMPELMNAADAYVMSSAWEGLPMVLLEAAACGLPIVATDVGGNREVVRDGVSGFIVPASDTVQLSDAVKRVMLLTETERLAMGYAGRDYVEQHYSLEKVVDIWERLYRELLVKKTLANDIRR